MMLDQKKRAYLKRVPVTLPLDKAVIFYVTVCTHNRRMLFDDQRLVSIAFNELCQSRTLLHWHVGGCVIMPDHVHFICGSPERSSQALSRFIQSWKSACSRVFNSLEMKGPYWQRGFFDRILRSHESYAAKWLYIKQNPERKAIHDFQRWFEIDEIRM